MARRRSRSSTRSSTMVKAVAAAVAAAMAAQPRPRKRAPARSGQSATKAIKALTRALRNDRPAPQGMAGSPQHVLWDGYGRPRRFR